jgi:hypothetical protein
MARQKFTTFLEPENVNWLKLKALDRGGRTSAADILNELIETAREKEPGEEGDRR